MGGERGSRGGGGTFYKSSGYGGNFKGLSYVVIMLSNFTKLTGPRSGEPIDFNGDLLGEIRERSKSHA